MSKAGARVHMVGYVGSDTAGQSMAKALTAAGVDVDHVQVRSSSVQEVARPVADAELRTGRREELVAFRADQRLCSFPGVALRVNTPGCWRTAGRCRGSHWSRFHAAVVTLGRHGTDTCSVLTSGRWDRLGLRLLRTRAGLHRKAWADCRRRGRRRGDEERLPNYTGQRCGSRGRTYAG
ncbi:PfkB family carbohydrate kinase [Nonomuraea sp. NPDC003707]